MSVRSRRLDRVSQGFQARARWLESRMMVLTHQMQDTEEAITSIQSAMTSPVVQSLSLEALVARRVADLRTTQQSLTLQLTQLRGELVDVKTKVRLASDLSETIERVEQLKESESQSFEVTTLMSLSSLWQVKSD